MNDIHLEVNAQAFSCPMPLLKAKQALNALEIGQRVKVTASDPGSERDFHAYVSLSEHLMISFEHQDGIFSYILQKGRKA